MMKQEFDNASAEAGFGRCADWMWPEIEDCCSTSDEIDRDLMVDIYWHEPGIYREILALRRAIADTARGMTGRSEGYAFPEVRSLHRRMKDLYYRLDETIADAKTRKTRRRTGTCRAD